MQKGRARFSLEEESRNVSGEEEIHPPLKRGPGSAASLAVRVARLSWWAGRV